MKQWYGYVFFYIRMVSRYHLVFACTFYDLIYVDLSYWLRYHIKSLVVYKMLHHTDEVKVILHNDIIKRYDPFVIMERTLE